MISLVLVKDQKINQDMQCTIQTEMLLKTTVMKQEQNRQAIIARQAYLVQTRSTLTVRQDRLQD